MFPLHINENVNEIMILFCSLHKDKMHSKLAGSDISFLYNKYNSYFVNNWRYDKNNPTFVNNVHSVDIVLNDN